MNPNTAAQTVIDFLRPDEGRFLIRLSGQWRITGNIPPVEKVREQIDSGPSIRILSFDTKGLTAWDTGLLSFLIKIKDLCNRIKIHFDDSGLPAGVRRLMTLASAVPEKKDAQRKEERISFLVDCR